MKRPEDNANTTSSADVDNSTDTSASASAGKKSKRKQVRFTLEIRPNSPKHIAASMIGRPATALTGVDQGRHSTAFGLMVRGITHFFNKPSKHQEGSRGWYKENRLKLYSFIERMSVLNGDAEKLLGDVKRAFAEYNANRMRKTVLKNIEYFLNQENKVGQSKAVSDQENSAEGALTQVVSGSLTHQEKIDEVAKLVSKGAFNYVPEGQEESEPVFKKIKKSLSNSLASDAKPVSVEKAVSRLPEQIFPREMTKNGGYEINNPFLNTLCKQLGNAAIAFCNGIPSIAFYNEVYPRVKGGKLLEYMGFKGLRWKGEGAPLQYLDQRYSTVSFEDPDQVMIDQEIASKDLEITDLKEKISQSASDRIVSINEKKIKALELDIARLQKTRLQVPSRNLVKAIYSLLDYRKLNVPPAITDPARLDELFYAGYRTNSEKHLIEVLARHLYIFVHAYPEAAAEYGCNVARQEYSMKFNFGVLSLFVDMMARDWCIIKNHSIFRLKEGVKSKFLSYTKVRPLAGIVEVIEKEASSASDTEGSDTDSSSLAVTTSIFAGNLSGKAKSSDSSTASPDPTNS